MDKIVEIISTLALSLVIKDLKRYAFDAIPKPPNKKQRNNIRESFISSGLL